MPPKRREQPTAPIEQGGTLTMNVAPLGSLRAARELRAANPHLYELETPEQVAAARAALQSVHDFLPTVETARKALREAGAELQRREAAATKSAEALGVSWHLAVPLAMRGLPGPLDNVSDPIADARLERDFQTWVARLLGGVEL